MGEMQMRAKLKLHLSEKNKDRKSGTRSPIPMHTFQRNEYKILHFELERINPKISLSSNGLICRDKSHN